MRRIVDALALLREHTPTAITSTTSEVGKLIYPTMQIEYYKAVIDIGTFDNTTTDETYVITIEIASTLNSTYNVIATLSSDIIKNGGANKTYMLPLSGYYNNYINSNSAYMRVTATLGGTSPSLTYGAFITV